MIKNIIKYITVFSSTVLICILLLTITAKIPKESLKENIKKSASQLNQKTEIVYSKKYDPYTYLHPYADVILLNIIYHIDTQKPLESVLKANYYEDIRNPLTKVVEEDKEANTEYLRYWHGSMVWIRPLLLFFSIEQIYQVNAILLSMLAILLIAMLWKKSHKLLAIGIIIATIMTGSFFVPWCLEYTWTYFIMLITSILAILLEKKGNAKLYMLFFIVGILTCFFDFLTTETLTVLVPLLLIMGIRYKENRIGKIQEEIKIVLIILIIWGIGYAGMWCAKWISASIVLQMNAMTFVTDNLLFRINGDIEEIGAGTMYLNALQKNILALYPLNKFVRPILTLSIPAILLIVFLPFKIKKNPKRDYLILIFLLGLLPYVRYLILTNHSYRHYFFTFRAQYATIIALIIVFIHSLDKQKLLQFIKKKKR